ncbi:RNA-binding protein 4.1-like [Neosynchiropus ocellatus]
MVKIFIGNVSSDTSAQELRELFEKYGAVSQCDIIKNYGFVHMDNVSEAEEAIKNLHQLELNGWRINVELSKGRPKSTTKLHVSNLSDDITQEVLKAKFEEFGPVTECDIVKDYAFVHMEQVEDAMNAIRMMDNTSFKGKLLRVQLSTSRHRTVPGMGNNSGCFVCGERGHWSKDCPAGRSDRGSMMRAGSDRGYQRGLPGFGIGSPAMSEYMGGSMYNQSSYAAGMQPLPPQGLGVSEHSDMYGNRPVESASAYDQSRLYCTADYYDKNRGQPYGSSYFEDRHMSYIPPPPPQPPAFSELSSVATNESSANHLPSAEHYARQYSSIGQASATRSGYERTQPSPASGRSAYQAPPSKDSDAHRYAPY